jgi:hypothetical protein
MKLLFLYGRPAVGKLTVARAVSARTGGRLFHNHLAVNLALSVYDFGTPGFIALREQVWNDVFRQVMADRLPLLIFTFNPENTVPQEYIDGLFARVSEAGGEVIPVELVASESEIESRLGSGSRRLDGKTMDAPMYRQLRETGAFDTPVITAPRLRLDTGKLTPPEAAERIVALLSGGD